MLSWRGEETLPPARPIEEHRAQEVVASLRGRPRAVLMTAASRPVRAGAGDSKTRRESVSHRTAIFSPRAVGVLAAHAVQRSVTGARVGPSPFMQSL